VSSPGAKGPRHQAQAPTGQSPGPVASELNERGAAAGPGRLDRLWGYLEGIPRLQRPLAFLVRRREQVLYLFVGGWNTLFGYLIWALLQYLLHDYIYYLGILVIAWFPSVLNAYLCYRWFVFRSKGSVWRELPRFSLVYVFTLCIGLVGLPILLRVLPFNIYVTQGLFTAAMVILSYLAHRYFSFGKNRHVKPTHAEAPAP